MGGVAHVFAERVQTPYLGIQPRVSLWGCVPRDSEQRDPLCHTLTLSRSRSLSLYLSLSLSLSNTHTHTLALSLSHTQTHTNTHTHAYKPKHTDKRFQGRVPCRVPLQGSHVRTVFFSSS